MPAIVTSVRFFQVGIIEWVYYATAVAPAAPTFAEINGGTRLANEVDEFSGWTSTTQFIETKDAVSFVAPKLAGRTVLDDSSLTFNGSSGTTDASTVFVRGAAGYILIAHKGLVAAKKADIYPVTVGGVVKVPSITDAPYKIRVDFGVTGAPTVDYTLPAGTYT